MRKRHLFLPPLFHNNWLPIDTLLSELYDDFFEVNGSSIRATTKEKKDKWLFKIMAPGIDKNLVEIETTRNILSVTYKNENADHDFESMKSWRKAWDLPKNADSENISASYKDGILIVEVPKSEKEKPRKITIK